MVVLADKLSSSLAGRTGHVLYMHLQNSKLLLKMGKKPQADLLVVLPARLYYHRTNPLVHGAVWIHGKLQADLPVEALDLLRGRAQTKRLQEQRA